MSMWLLIRTVLYAVLIVSSFLAWVLAAAFIGKTEADFDTYYGSAACVLVAGLLAFFTIPVLYYFFHRRDKTTLVGSTAVELGVVFVLWALFLGGAAGMADRLPGLSSSFCSGTLCSLGRAVEAFAWISWVALTFLLIGLIVFGAIAHKRHGAAVWREPLSTNLGSHSAGGATTEKGVGHTPATGPAAGVTPAGPATASNTV